MSPSCISARKGEGRCRMEICNVPYFLQQSRHRSQSRHQIGERQHRPEIRWNQAACRESLQLCGPDGRHQRAAGCFQLALLQRCFRVPGLRYAKRVLGCPRAVTEPYLANLCSPTYRYVTSTVWAAKCGVVNPLMPAARAVSGHLLTRTSCSHGTSWVALQPIWCHLPQYADRSEREYPSTVMTGNGKPLVLAHRTFCP